MSIELNLSVLQLRNFILKSSTFSEKFKLNCVEQNACFLIKFESLKQQVSVHHVFGPTNSQLLHCDKTLCVFTLKLNCLVAVTSRPSSPSSSE